MPIVAVVDPDMMATMPKGLTASTGMDALTHAIEGYITLAAWEMTDMFHLKAIEIISRSLRGAVAGTPEGREGMALGQYVAGMGFSNVGLGIAHSMAHTLGAVYDTPHGVACAMMLPIVMAYNAPCTGGKYREIARAMGVPGVDDMGEEQYRAAAVQAVRQLSADVGIPSKLEAIREEDLHSWPSPPMPTPAAPATRVIRAWRTSRRSSARSCDGHPGSDGRLVRMDVPVWTGVPVRTGEWFEWAFRFTGCAARALLPRRALFDGPLCPPAAASVCAPPRPPLCSAPRKRFSRRPPLCPVLRARGVSLPRTVTACAQ